MQYSALQVDEVGREVDNSYLRNKQIFCMKPSRRVTTTLRCAKPVNPETKSKPFYPREVEPRLHRSVSHCGLHGMLEANVQGT